MVLSRLVSSCLVSSRFVSCILFGILFMLLFYQSFSYCVLLSRKPRVWLEYVICLVRLVIVHFSKCFSITIIIGVLMAPPTTISIVAIELLSELVEHSWQYKLSSDVVKILEIGFVQKCIFLRSDIKKLYYGRTYVSIHQKHLEQLTCYQRNMINILLHFVVTIII